MGDFGTKGVQASESQVSKWMPAPSVRKAKIVSFKYFESALKGTPGIEVIIATDPVEGVAPHEYNEDQTGTGQICVERWWLTDKARPSTMARLALIADEFAFRDELDEKSAGSAEEYVDEIADLFLDLEACWLIVGEQVWLAQRDQDGNETGEYSEWIKPSIHRYGFVKKVENGQVLVERLKKLRNPIRTNPKPQSQSVTNNGMETDVEINW